MNEPMQPQAPMAPKESHKLSLTPGQVFAVCAITLALVMCAFAFGTMLGADKGEDDFVLTPTEDEVLVPDGKGDDTEDGEVVDNAGELQVTWRALDDQYKEAAPLDLVNAYDEYTAQGERFVDLEAYNIGKVIDSEGNSYRLIDNVVGQEGLGTFYRHFFTLENRDGEPIVLTRYLLNQGAGSFEADFDAQFPANKSGLTFSDVLVKNGFSLSDATIGSFELYRDVEPYKNNSADPLVFAAQEDAPDSYALTAISSRFQSLEDKDALDLPIAGHLEDGTELRLYTESAGSGMMFQRTEQSFLAVHPSGLTLWFDAKIPFWPDSPYAPAVPEVTVNGSPLTDTYLKTLVGGCGAAAVVHVADKKEVGAIKEIGYATKERSVKIYGPQTYAGEYYATEFANWQRMAGNENKTLEEFAAITPFFYYTDVFGRFLEFSSTEVVPPGECGKPVIYLYPQTKTDLTVNLAPVGGFTVTEPAYNNGWNVTAYPSGKLVNKADGLTYPYLFWEGLGGAYAEPNRYWVVPQKDVHSFLTSTLTKLGLNAQESKDFMEFWEPLMQAAPYYKIGFHGTKTMDEIAPLSLSQTPDTIFRILMDYQELQSPVPSKPPTLPPTPVRKGFTVVEWGGVLRHE